MITFTKDKNNIKIEVSGTNGYYRFDLNSGVFYGKKGGAIKSLPLPISDFCNALYKCEQNKNLYLAIRAMLQNEGANTANYRKERWLSIYNTAEKIDGLGVTCVINSTYTLETIAQHFEQFVKYANEAKEKNISMSNDWVNKFPSYIRYIEAKAECGKYHEFITPRMYEYVKNSCNFELNEELWGVLAYYLVKQKVWEFCGNSATKVIEYLSWCRYMNKTPEKTSSFTREYAETKNTYLLKKEEYDNKKMQDHFAKHSKAFNFTYGNYTIVIPKTAQDIVDEGANMHHCVGGYAQDVVNGNQYIIFIRHKDTPNKCYITCQVSNNGKIGQYFLAYDHYITSAEDREFYSALADHLNKNW
jgi:hypothetical protein